MKPLFATENLQPFLIMVVLFAIPTAMILSPLLGRSSEGVVIGYTQYGRDSRWVEEAGESVLSAAKQRGWEVIYHNGRMLQQNQIKAVRYFIAREVDIIVLSSQESTGWQAVLGSAHDAGIPVILMDRNIESDPAFYATRISSDFENEGRLAADAIARLLGGRGQVVQVSGTPGSSAAQGRSAGFESWLSRFRGIHLLASRSGEFNRIESRRTVSSVLRKEGREVDALFLQDEETAYGALAAIYDLSWARERPPVLVAVGGTERFIELLRTPGERGPAIDALVYSSPEYGAQVIKAVDTILNGESIEPLIRLESRVIFSGDLQ